MERKAAEGTWEKVRKEDYEPLILPTWFMKLKGTPPCWIRVQSGSPRYATFRESSAPNGAGARVAVHPPNPAPYCCCTCRRRGPAPAAGPCPEPDGPLDPARGDPRIPEPGGPLDPALGGPGRSEPGDRLDPVLGDPCRPGTDVPLPLPLEERLSHSEAARSASRSDRNIL